MGSLRSDFLGRVQISKVSSLRCRCRGKIMDKIELGEAFIWSLCGPAVPRPNESRVRFLEAAVRNMANSVVVGFNQMII